MMGSILVSLMVLLPGSGDPPHESEYTILAPGTLPWDIVRTVSGDSWLGLYESGTDCELRNTELIVEDLYFFGEDQHRTGSEVSAADTADEPLFFLRPLGPVFQEGSIPTALVNSPVLLPGDEIDLGEYGFLYATEKGLFLSNGETSQRLSSVYPDSHGEEVSVIWAGDIDGDGLVDIILDDQPHYAYLIYLRLFLSSEATGSSLVREVAWFGAVAC